MLATSVLVTNTSREAQITLYSYDYGNSKNFKNDDRLSFLHLLFGAILKR